MEGWETENVKRISASIEALFLTLPPLSIEPIIQSQLILENNAKRDKK